MRERIEREREKEREKRERERERERDGKKEEAHACDPKGSADLYGTLE